MQDITPFQHAAAHRFPARRAIRVVALLFACCFPMLSATTQASGGPVVELHQEDFRFGTHIIDRPGAIY